MKRFHGWRQFLPAVVIVAAACGRARQTSATALLDDGVLGNLVRRSYSQLLNTPLWEAGDAARPSRQLQFKNEPWTGDFDGMVDRRIIRVLVPYSRALYYIDLARERGVTGELVRDFESYLNRKYARQLARRPLTVVIMPVTRDRLIPDVATGLGDIAAGNLTETPARLEMVDFVAPRDRKPVKEVVVRGPDSPPISSIEDLAGQRVHVRKASSYYESLMALDARLRSERRTPLTLTIVPDALEDEDLMEMLNAGLFGLVVVDEPKAKAWAQVLAKITVTDVTVAEKGFTGWAIRKDSPKLAGAIRDFYVNWVKPRGGIEFRVAQAQKRVKQISNNTTTAAWTRFQRTWALFERYGAKYDFDPLMLAAQGYQESQLRQDARSPAGAVGVMQITPATGADMKVGDVTRLESNIHAAAKYMDHLMATYFGDARFSDQDRVLFALASYNAGPGRIRQMRREAHRRGLDPDRWFENVELVVAEKVGVETPTYVRNVYKYYTAYRLRLEMEETQRRAREEVAVAP